MLASGRKTLKPSLVILLSLLFISCDLTGLLNRGQQPSKEVSAPIISGTTPTNVRRPTWTWTVDEQASAVSYMLDSSSWTTDTPSVTSFTPSGDLSDGSHVLSVRVKDSLGAWSTTSQYTIVVDTVPPIPPAVSAVIVESQLKPHWSWSAGSDSTGFRYQLDSESAAGWTLAGAGVFSFTPDVDLSLAQHTLYVQAVDIAGNWSSSGSALIDLDPDIPDVSGATVTCSSTPTWTWTMGVPVAAFSFRLDDEQWTDAGVDAHSYTASQPLSDGSHVFWVKAMTIDGVWTAASQWTTVIDTVPPDAPRVQGTTPTAEKYPLWSWNVPNDVTTGVGSFRYQLDGETGTWTEVPLAVTIYRLPFLMTEPHTLYVQAADLAGNWSASGSFRTESVWSSRILDADITSAPGQQISAAVSPITGYPLVAYADATTHDLVTMQWNGSAWQKQVVDAGGAGLRIVSTYDYIGHSVFSYTGPTESVLKAKYFDLFGDKIEKITAITDGDGQAVITLLKMVVDRGLRPRILYQREGHNVRFVYIEKIQKFVDPPADLAGEFGQALSTEVSEFGLILSMTATELRMRELTVSGWLTLKRISSTTADAGCQTSITSDLESGIPIQRAVFTTSLNEIKYAYGTWNSGWNSPVVIHPASSVGISCLQITWDALNMKPVIAYTIGSDLYCYVNGTEEIVASGVSASASVAVDPTGRIHIFYYDSTTGVVKYATRN